MCPIGIESCEIVIVPMTPPGRHRFGTDTPNCTDSVVPHHTIDCIGSSTRSPGMVRQNASLVPLETLDSRVLIARRAESASNSLALRIASRARPEIWAKTWIKKADPGDTIGGAKTLHSTRSPGRVVSTADPSAHRGAGSSGR